MDGIEITEHEFSKFQRMLHDIAGINLSPAKKPLLCGRLAQRLRAYNLDSYEDYFKLLMGDASRVELQTAIDLLTTNETYFFREPKHFDFLRDKILPQRARARAFRVWSAASSSGEEVYSIAMLLADVLNDEPWEIIGSDLSLRVLQKARAGHYPASRTKDIPPRYLSNFCLRGVGAQQGTVLIGKELRNRVRFLQVNLNTVLPRMGEFDVIFLRNVMIYFNADTKRQVVNRLLPALKPGGYLLIGHSESLNGVNEGLHMIAPSIYRKP